MKTEGLDLSFTDGAIEKIAHIAWKVNEKTENIGARRLHTVLEHLLEQVSFDAGDAQKGSFKVTSEYVESQLDELSEDEDLSQYIL